MAKAGLENRGIPLVEYLAAAAIFCIAAIVLYMVFVYKPY